MEVQLREYKFIREFSTGNINKWITLYLTGTSYLPLSSSWGLNPLVLNRGISLCFAKKKEKFPVAT
jgi:hypothetical protein